MVAAGCKVLRRPGREAVLCAAGGGHYTYNSGSGVVWILMGWNGNSLGDQTVHKRDCLIFLKKFQSRPPPHHDLQGRGKEDRICQKVGNTIIEKHCGIEVKDVSSKWSQFCTSTPPFGREDFQSVPPNYQIW
jgi:hypothetical protein